MEKIITLLILSIIGSFGSPNTNKDNQSSPCFMDSGAWQLISYRNNTNNTEDLRPDFEYTGSGRMNLIIKFEKGKGNQSGRIKGHSLSSWFTGSFTWKEDSIKIKPLSVFPVNEPLWGLDGLLDVLKNCSSYSCDDDYLYINYYGDNHTAVFFKTDSLQYPKSLLGIE